MFDWLAERAILISSSEKRKIDRENRISQYLLAEYKNVVKAINNALDSRAKIFAVGITLVSYFTLMAPAEYRPYAFVLLPITVTGLIQYYIHLLHEISLLRGYRKWLEEQLNEGVQERLLSWESSLYRLLNTGAIDRFGPLSFGLVFTIGMSVWLSIETCLVHSGKHHLRVLFWVGLGGFAILCVLLVRSWFGMSQAFNAAYQRLARSGGQQRSVISPAP